MQGVRCLGKYYTIKDGKVWVGAAIDLDIPNHVRFKSRRTVEGLVYPIGNVIEKNEFFNDVDFLINFFKGFDDIDDNTIAKAFLEICARHITDNQRIIDTEVYLYADETILVASNIFFDMFGILLTDEMCKSAFPELVNHALTYFKKYIYITKYQKEGDLMKLYLVKLTDL